MSIKTIDSKFNFNHFLDYIQRLKDPILVSKFQNYFGVRVVGNNNSDTKHLKTKTTYSSNGFYNEMKSFNNTYVNQKKDCHQNGKQSTSSQEIIPEESSETIHYVIENQFWYYLFSFGASLGYELFYASFFPIWFWNIDSAVGRRLVLVWVIVMYFGQALKDVVKWPRPASPPVVILEPEYANEYGMPSTHAMVGSALPVSLIIFTLNRYEVIVFLWDNT